jgi:hypothetical protein
MTHSLTLTFTGDLPPASFAAFARHRAARLSLGLDLLSQSPTATTLRIDGPPDLLDAFEMALSLGPRDCLVRDVRAHP